MSICKHYVNRRCNNNNCRFEHIDNICINHFFGECTSNNCKFTHEYKLENKDNKDNKDNKNNYNINKNFNRIVKNKETFVPTIRVRFNNVITYSNEVSINNNIFYDKNLYKSLLSEIDDKVYKPWNGDTHLIADDSHNIDWKSRSPTFDKIVKQLCSYFCMTPSVTRLNFYKESYWKPYHHDASALKQDKEKTQNITVGVSFGETRDFSFESTHKNINDRIRLNFPLDNGTVYSFGNKVNIDFRHGIPPLKNNKNTNNSYNGRFSIIIWGYSTLLD
uniref:C3H1-type domain-containing protein n=1 Tax=viral metagenome TaxID=1070528 RepID=A0A6C0LCM3_9ZZZZ